VQPAVQHEELLDVVGLFDPLLQVAQFGEVVVGQAGGRLGQQEGSIRSRIVVECAIPHAHGGDPGALAGRHGDQAGRPEDPRRLAHRQPTAAQPGGDLVLLDPGARGKRPRQDPVAQSTPVPVGRRRRGPGRTPCRRGRTPAQIDVVSDVLAVRQDAALGGDDHAVAVGGDLLTQRLAVPALRDAEAVTLRGVEEVDARLPRVADRRDGSVLVERPPVAAELPGAESEQRDLVAGPDPAGLQEGLLAVDDVQAGLFSA
jgi:hypothetical protein